MATRINTVPPGPASSNRVRASAAPNWTEPTATATKRSARGAKSDLARFQVCATLLGTERDGTLRFRATPGIRRRLAAIVAAEAECCAFLSLSLHEANGELLLEVSAPPDAEPVAAELARAFAGR